MERTILHCDLNGFFAAVECLFNPELKNVAMAVAGNAENRHGIILAKNEIAKKYNIQTAETTWEAKKKCPGLVLVPPRHEEYDRYSKLVNDIYCEFSDRVEPFGIDESWLDVTGVTHLFGSGLEIADKIREAVKTRLGLTISVGVSFNKVFAKLGSDYKKPDATTVITHNNYKKIVWPLPVSDLLYVGKSTNAILLKWGIRTIGELANTNKKFLVSHLGKMGETIHDYANGIDKSPVAEANAEREIKSVGNGMTFSHDLVGYEEIKKGVLTLADEVGSRMRQYKLKCRAICVQIKDPCFKSISRQKTLTTATFSTKEIADTAMELIVKCWSERAPMRTLTISGKNLIESSNATEQRSLFGDDDKKTREKQDKLERAMDTIRNQLGHKSIGFGCVMMDEAKTKTES